MLEVSGVVNLGKLMLELARAYASARQRSGSHQLKPDLLITLHESICRLKRSTDSLRDQRLHPNLSSAMDAMTNRWHQDFLHVLRDLDNVDIATVRVYSPELAERLQYEVTTREALVLDHEGDLPIRKERADQLLEIRAKLDDLQERLGRGVYAPIMTNQETSDDLAALSGVLEEFANQLREFISQSWPLHTLGDVKSK